MLRNLLKPRKETRNANEIAKEMETVRSQYLKELGKLRQKYVQAFTSLSVEYDDACRLAQR